MVLARTAAGYPLRLAPTSYSIEGSGAVSGPTTVSSSSYTHLTNTLDQLHCVVVDIMAQTQRPILWCQRARRRDIRCGWRLLVQRRRFHARLMAHTTVSSSSYTIVKQHVDQLHCVVVDIRLRAQPSIVSQ